MTDGLWYEYPAILSKNMFHLWVSFLEESFLYLSVNDK